MIDGFGLRRGDTYTWTVTFDDGADPPVPIDISGRTLTFTVKSARTDPDSAALVQSSVTFPNDSQSQLGVGVLFVPHSQTIKLIPGQKVYYDFQLAYYDEQQRLVVTTLEAGTVKVDWDVTENVPAP